MNLLKFTLIDNQIDQFRIFDAQNCNMSSFVSFLKYTLYFLKVSCQDTQTFMTPDLIHVSNWTGKIWTSDFPKKFQWAHW